MLVAPLENWYIGVRPSRALEDHIRGIESENGMPKNILNFRSAEESADPEPNCNQELLFEATDQQFIDSLGLDHAQKDYMRYEDRVDNGCGNLLYLKDLHWIKERIDAGDDKDVYFNELFEGSILVLPKNKRVSRNEDLEKRCIRMRAQQKNTEYDNMVKNVDSSRRKYPEDSISQMTKHIETELIAVFQFIVSVLASFIFGCFGVGWMIGAEKEGFRIIRGLMCAFVVAVAELYFLLKKFTVHLNNNKQET